MITACHNCEYNRRGAMLEALLPGRPKNAKVATAKETLARFFLSQCKNCKRGTQHDDIRIQHSPHNRDELTRSTIQPPAEPCTALPESVEDTLRRLLCTITGLDLLDALLLLHVAKGGTPGNFGRTLNAALKEAGTYGEAMSRATSKAKWDAMCRKFAPFKALRSWGIGHGGRTAEDRDDDEPTYQQAEMEFANP